jgi:hypothetical protein
MSESNTEARPKDATDHVEHRPPPGEPGKAGVTVRGSHWATSATVGYIFKR